MPITNPQLIQEWNTEKNTGHSYLDFSSNFHDKVWWKCVLGHEWQATIKDRSQGTGCPYCSNRKVLKGFNDLQTTHPLIALEWNYTKNVLSPAEVTSGSHKKVWWICNLGHEWECVIYKRTTPKQGCPYCSNHKILRGFNDLATTNPELANEWNTQRNTTITCEEVTAGSHKEVWWVCPKGHEWKAQIKARNNGNGCPLCKKESQTSFPEQAIYYYLSQVTSAINRYKYNNSIEIDIYLPEFQFGIEYDGYYYHTQKDSAQLEAKKNYILKRNGINLLRVKEYIHENECVPNNDIIYCKTTINYDYLNDVLKEIFKRLHENYNLQSDIVFDVVKDTSTILAMFIASTKDNSISSTHPNLLSEWNAEKNKSLNPDYFTAGSSKKLWWKCKLGHEWQATLSDRTSDNRGCPYCSNRQVLKGFNDLSTLRSDLAAEWDYEGNGHLMPTEVTIGSGRNIAWRCRLGHRWKNSIAHRTSGQGCPYCSNKKLLIGFNDLETRYPEIALDWHPTKNKGLLPNQVLLGSAKSVWWKCHTCNHEWKTKIIMRTRGSGCPICKRNAGRNKVIKNHIAVNGSLQDQYPCIAALWHPSLNGNLFPSDITPDSGKYAWWKCPACGYVWKAEIKNKTKSKYLCPQCHLPKPKNI